jgi:hypothetical protein
VIAGPSAVKPPTGPGSHIGGPQLLSFSSGTANGSDGTGTLSWDGIRDRRVIAKGGQGSVSTCTWNGAVVAVKTVDAIHAQVCFALAPATLALVLCTPRVLHPSNA